ncbi:MAG: trimeric intracellular cation channel family protein, partial [Croceimicrobium sp.]
MPLQDLIFVLDLLGTLVFAISGVIAAVDRKFDLVGAFIIGFVTALGGGTTRDLLMGNTPVTWMLEP